MAPCSRLAPGLIAGAMTARLCRAERHPFTGDEFMQIQVLRGHAFGVLCLILPGCVSSGRAGYVAMRTEYGAVASRMEAARAPDDRWLATAPLERGALVRAVLERNPSVAAAIDTWRATLARYRQAGSFDDPTLKLMAAPLSIAAAHAPLGYEVGLSQRIPLGSKLDAEASLAIAEAEAAKGDYAAVGLELAGMASLLYDDYFVAVRSAEINAEHVEFVQALKQNAITAYETGRARAQESLMAEAELAQLEYDRVALDTERSVIVARLNTLLHRDPEAVLPPPPADLPPPSASSEADVRTLAQRPDITTARAKIRIAGARIRIAEQSTLPDLLLSTTYNSMWAMPEHRWLAGVEIDLPLPRERREGAVEEAQALRAAAERDLERVTDLARAELTIARLRVAEARQNLQLHDQRLLPIARDRVTSAQSGLIASEGGFSVLLEAARALRTLELRRPILIAELSRRVAELERTQGRMPGMVDAPVQP
jgi:cobalt-zinc-cadmium efflux system outer membrane protein